MEIALVFSMVNDTNNNKYAEKKEVYKIISATETMDIYYIFLMPPKRETRGHQMKLVKGSIRKRSWHFKECGEDRLMSCQRTLWMQEVSTGVRQDKAK